MYSFSLKYADIISIFPLFFSKLYVSSNKSCQFKNENN